MAAAVEAKVDQLTLLVQEINNKVDSLNEKSTALLASKSRAKKSENDPSKPSRPNIKNDFIAVFIATPDFRERYMTNTKDIVDETVLKKYAAKVWTSLDVSQKKEFRDLLDTIRDRKLRQENGTATVPAAHS